MKTIVLLLGVLFSAQVLAQVDYRRPDPMAEYAARQRIEAEEQRRQYEMERQRQQQESQRQQFNNQMGGVPIQGIPYQVNRGR